ncbi:YigZ family protein [uncultured Sunxiuqinia sp.]|uniref:YigZ family protein n=1 Tax=uncultured Sunxiuqinia sp. TaxID=1573825 RepID=UPI00260459BC|nr:YigZ family protein [uncultured Sunxiuqinia sp.]
MTDSFRTIAEAAEGLFKDKGSKFIAYAFPVETEDEIKEHIQDLKKAHHSARHHCYAWRLGAAKKRFRANDDGEPSSTAGKPILGQIKRLELTNVLVVVVRYFGGTLLGVGGLINAYKAAAADVLDQTTIIEKLVETYFTLDFDYPNMNPVMRIFKEEELEQKETRFELRCQITTSVRQSEAERIMEKFRKIHGVNVTLVD